MSESKSFTIDLDDPCREDLGQTRVRMLPHRGLDQSHGRIGECCGNTGDLDRGRPQSVEAGPDEGLQIRWNRQLLTRGDHATSTLQGGSELDHEEGVAARS